MRRVLLLPGVLLLTTSAFAQAPAAQQPAAPRPAQPSPAPAAARRPPVPPARSGMAITVTDARGGTLRGIHVEVLGSSDRSGDTDGSGQINFTGMQAGPYRLRFTGDGVITFEKEVAIRAGQVADVDVTLNPAPTPPEPVAPPPPPPPPLPPPPVVGPAGQALTLSVPELLEKNFVGTQPRRETLLSCSGNTRTTMIQLNMPLPERLYEAADVTYYVIGGEGAVRLAGREAKLATNAFVSVPRGTEHSFTRSGRRPLILLAVLSGEPCEEAK